MALTSSSTKLLLIAIAAFSIVCVSCHAAPRVLYPPFLYRYLYNLGGELADERNMDKRDTVFMPNAEDYERSQVLRGRFGFGIGKRSNRDEIAIDLKDDPGFENKKQ